MANRFIPHDHQCQICGVTEGCEDKYCPVEGLYRVCNKPDCWARYNARTVHLALNDVRLTDGILTCCGQPRSSTPPEDTMTADPRKVTCTGPKLKVDASVPSAATGLEVNGRT